MPNEKPATTEEPKKETKKKEAEPAPKLNALQKLQTVRKVLATSPLKKTGKNTFANNGKGYSYFQLDDFMPTATVSFEKVGLTPQFNYSTEKDADGVVTTWATLTIYNNDNPAETINYRLPWVSSNQSSNPIQTLGSSVTYLRRYLMMMALDLSETDITEETTGSPEDHSKENAKLAEAKHAAQPKPQAQARVPMISQQQAEKILNLYKPQEIESMSKKNGHGALGEWTAVEAAKAIRFRENAAQ